MSKPVHARLQPINTADWSDDLADLRSAFFGQTNVYRVMAHHPALLRAWTALRQHIVVDTTLGQDRSEIAILRAATRTASPYEWSHHVLRARKLGIADARIILLRGTPANMAQEDATIAVAVDELIDTARLTPGTLQALSDLVGDKGVLDLMATVGFYATLAFMLNSFETEIDASVVAALAERPLRD